jgi:salicylate hydroxylase
MRRQQLRAQRGWLTPDSLVAVVGGGLGGLATALALQQAGLRARVYERDSGFAVRRQGYGLTLSTTNSALAALGLLEELRQRDVPSRSHFVFGSDGEILGYFGNALTGRGRGDRPLPDRGNLRVPRQVLRQMLLDRLAPGTVEWSCQLTDFAEHPAAKGGGGGGVTLTFASGEVVEAAALIGADGIHSAVRCQRRPLAQPPEYLGVLAVVGITEVAHPLLHERGFYTLDGQIRLFTMPFSRAAGPSGQPAQTMWQLSLSMPEAEARSLAAGGSAALLQELQRRCKDWHAPVPAMLHGTDPGALWAAPLCDAPPPPAPKKGSSSVVTVLGDAAHPMGKQARASKATAYKTTQPLLLTSLQQQPTKPVVHCQLYLRSVRLSRVDSCPHHP